MSNRLYRHPTDKVIGGVAAGIGAWLNVDVSIVRIAWVLLAIFTTGIFVLVYFVMLFVVPLPPAGWVPPAGTAPGGSAPGGAPGWTAPPPGGAPGGWQPQEPRPWSVGGVDGGNAGIIGGVVLIGLGAWFLVDQYLDIRIDWSLLWPAVIIVLGVLLIVRASRSRGPSG